jgi:hypothetical protein
VLNPRQKYSLNKISATIVVIIFLMVFILNDSISLAGRARSYINALFFGVPVTGLLLVLFPKHYSRTDKKNWVGKPSPPAVFYRFFGWVCIIVPIIAFVILQ